MSRHLWLVVIVGLLLAGSSLAWAQGGGSGEMRRMELERTDQLIERAESAIRSSDNPAGADLLNQAKELQSRAWGRYQNGDYAAARTLTFQARELLKKAVNQSRHQEQTESIVLRHLEYAGDRLDRAQEVLSQLEDQSLVAIYESARDNLKRAWEFYNNKQYRPALKLAEQAEKAAEKILNAREGKRADSSYERRHEMVAGVIQQARDILATCDSRKGRLHLEHAEKALQTAEEMAAKNRTTAAMQALQRAREMATKAMRECRGGELLQARYDRLVSQADQLKERSLVLSGQNRDIVDRLLIQAYEQLSLARGYIQTTESEKALAALQAASLALRQAETYI